MLSEWRCAEPKVFTVRLGNVSNNKVFLITPNYRAIFPVTFWRRTSSSAITEVLVENDLVLTVNQIVRTFIIQAVEFVVGAVVGV